MTKKRLTNKGSNSRPWDLIPGETPKAFEAFQRYLELGVNRSLVKLSQITGRHAKNMQVWSKKYKWVQRSRTYDAYIATLKTESTEDELESMTREHMAIISGIRSVIAVPIQVLIDKLGANMNENGELTLDELQGMTFLELLDRIEPYIKHLPAIIKLERLLTGLPTLSAEAVVRHDYSKVREEFREYILNTPSERIAEIIERAKRRLKNQMAK